MAAKRKKSVDLGFLPSKLREKLMPFQEEGVKFAIDKQARVLIGDEMGLGKTLQALAVAYFYQDVWPLLIIVPSSLRYPWIEEVEKWLPQVDPAQINLIQSGADIHSIPSSAISVVTYGLLRCPSSRLLQEALINQEFKVIIADESHYIKNRRSATSKFLVPLLQRAEHKILLTGTPALARPEELFPQLDALCPGKFGNWSKFAQRYCNARWQYFGRMRKWNTQGASNLQELQQLLCQHVMIRRLKKDVLKQLPPKQRQKVPFVVKDSELKKDLDRTWDELDKVMNGNRLSMAQVLQGAEVNEPSGSFQVHALMSALYKKTAVVKLGPVKEYVKMLCENQGLKFLVFAFHHVMMDAITEELHDNKVDFIRIDGHTPNQERPHLVHQFQVDKNIRVAVLSIKAAGVGLTLTAARLVVFAELDWTPGTLEQCEDRAHRIGQQDTVHVHYLVARGTLDEWVWSALARKTTVVTTTLNGKRQVLSMEHGNKGLTDCLSSADAWKPSDQTQASQDLEEYFTVSQLPSNQKTVLDFFSSQSNKNKRKPGSHSKNSSPRKRRKHNSAASGNSDCAIILDSDHEDEFQAPKMQLRMPVEPTQSTIETTKSSPTQPTTPRQSGAIWSCSVCTYDNHKALTACEMCASPKNPRTRSKLQAGTLQEQQEILHTVTGQEADEGSQDDRLHISDYDSEEESSTRTGDAQKRQLTSTPCIGKTRVEKHHHAGSQEEQGEADAEADSLPEITAHKHSKHKLKSPAQKKTNQIVNEPQPATSRSPYGTPNKKRFSFHFGSASKEKVDVHGSAVCEAGESTGQTDMEAGDERVNNSQQSSCSFNEDVATASFSITSDFDLDSDEDTLPADTTNTHSISELSHSHTSHRSVYSSDTDVEEGPAEHGTKPEQQSGYSDDTDIDEDYIEKCSKSSSKTNHNKSTLSNKSGKHCIKNAKSCDIGDKDCISNHAKPSSSLEMSAAETAHSRTAGEAAVLDEEVEAAVSLLAPVSRPYSGCPPWTCPNCSTNNDGDDEDCDGCFKPRPEFPVALETNDAEVSGSVTEADSRVVDLDQVPTYPLFYYGCSRNTNRIYLYNQIRIPGVQSIILSTVKPVQSDRTSGRSLWTGGRCSQAKEPLHLNFMPLDVECENYSALPDILLHPDNLRLVRRFIREWNSLALTKRRVVSRSGEVFSNPCLFYEEIKTGNKSSTQRYTSKADTAAVAMSKAQEVGGSVRLIARPPPRRAKGKVTDLSSFLTSSTKENVKDHAKAGGSKSSSSTEVNLSSLADVDWDTLKGVVQAVSADGSPLCLQCHEAYQSPLVKTSTIKAHAWATRFCNKHCAEKYWMQHHREFSKQRVFETEHGVCQMCGIDAQKLFERIKITKDIDKRARLLQESGYKKLSAETKQRMATQPNKGLFWHVDHINPVSLGGGECDIDNLRTLCTPCHRDVTSQQIRERAQDKAKQKRLRSAANSLDITAFFQPR